MSQHDAYNTACSSLLLCFAAPLDLTDVLDVTASLQFKTFHTALVGTPCFSLVTLRLFSDAATLS